jgi:polyhydroxyalkanoate synthesis regulator phasin
MTATRVTPLSRVGDSVRRLQEEADRVVSQVRSRISDFARSPARELDNLVGEARKVRGNVRSQVRTAVRRVEEGAEPILDRVEQRLADALRPLVRYLRLASQADVEALQRRITSLEKRVQDLSKAAEAA